MKLRMSRRGIGWVLVALGCVLAAAWVESGWRKVWWLGYTNRPGVSRSFEVRLVRGCIVIDDYEDAADAASWRSTFMSRWYRSRVAGGPSWDWWFGGQRVIPLRVPMLTVAVPLWASLLAIGPVGVWMVRSGRIRAGHCRCG